jgi:peptidyl-prolyl cis-trans isomerase C
MKRAALLLPALLFAACSKPGDKVIARVGSEKITEAMLQAKMEDVSPAGQEYLATRAGRRQFLDVLIHERLILQAARKSPVAAGEAYNEAVERKEAEMRRNMEEYREFLLTKMWVDDMRGGELKVGDEEVERYYSENPYQVTLGHILMADSAAAEEVYRKLKAGANFENLARERSLDRESVRLPPVMRGEFMPELEDMAFKMRAGETQGVVKTPLGYHILKKLSQDAVPQKDAAERIRKILEKKKFDAYLDKFREKAKVEVIDESYR